MLRAQNQAKIQRTYHCHPAFEPITLMTHQYVTWPLKVKGDSRYSQIFNTYKCLCYLTLRMLRYNCIPSTARHLVISLWSRQAVAPTIVSEERFPVQQGHRLETHRQEGESAHWTPQWWSLRCSRSLQGDPQHAHQCPVWAPLSAGPLTAPRWTWHGNMGCMLTGSLCRKDPFIQWTTNPHTHLYSSYYQGRKDTSIQLWDQPTHLYSYSQG